MPLTVVNVAYPFAPVTADPVGGGEQVLAQLDRALVAQGHRSIVAACAGSNVAGELVASPAAQGEITQDTRSATHAELRALVTRTIAHTRADVVHMHGIDFDSYMPPPGPPLLVTLHLPLSWYAPSALAPARPRTWLAPVSSDQARRAPAHAVLLEPVDNGVDLEVFRPGRKRNFVLALGRICPEKGFHHALDAARESGLPMLLAGAVFPYAEHRRYFAEQIRPRLDVRRRWIGPVTGAAKARLIAGARGLVAPSLLPETSSLVAREALASGTPVAGLRAGALADAIEDGRTGHLVDAPEDLADAILRCLTLKPDDCRAAAEQRFSLSTTIERYMALYDTLAKDASPRLLCGLTAGARQELSAR